MIPQDEILGRFARQERLREHRTTSFPSRFSRPYGAALVFRYPTQDYVLDYFQSSLRDLSFLRETAFSAQTFPQPPLAPEGAFFY